MQRQIMVPLFPQTALVKLFDRDKLELSLFVRKFTQVHRGERSMSQAPKEAVLVDFARTIAQLNGHGMQ